jgi:TPR repeat protein
MNRTCKAAVAALIFAVGFAGSAAAGPHEDAAAAYDKGDYATALRLIHPLADHGDAPAQYRLGDMYAYGKGVTQDYALAMIWYQKAAEQGYAYAQYALGLMYSNSYGGVPPDFVLGYKWLSLSTTRLKDDAANFAAVFRDIVAKKMSPAQIAEAQKLAREWKPK